MESQEGESHSQRSPSSTSQALEKWLWRLASLKGTVGRPVSGEGLCWDCSRPDSRNIGLGKAPSSPALLATPRSPGGSEHPGRSSLGAGQA